MPHQTVYKNYIIHNYQESQSTNQLAFYLAKRNHITHNHIISSQQQSGGKGRYGRNWDSPIGNLYFSLILKPNKNLIASSLLSFIGTASLGLALEELNLDPSTISYKWPNDLLVNGKKVAGLLLESDTDSDKVNFVVLGIGVNIKSHPSDVIYPAGNLEEEGFCKVTSEELLIKFLDKFDDLYKKWLDFGFNPIRNLWIKKAFKLGEEISINLAHQKTKGFFRDLDQNGNLVLELENKETILISSGEIFS